MLGTSREPSRVAMPKSTTQPARHTEKFFTNNLLVKEGVRHKPVAARAVIRIPMQHARYGHMTCNATVCGSRKLIQYISLVGATERTWWRLISSVIGCPNLSSTLCNRI